MSKMAPLNLDKKTTQDISMAYIQVNIIQPFYHQKAERSDQTYLVNLMDEGDENAYSDILHFLRAKRHSCECSVFLSFPVLYFYYFRVLLFFVCFFFFLQHLLNMSILVHSQEIALVPLRANILQIVYLFWLTYFVSQECHQMKSMFMYSYSMWLLNRCVITRLVRIDIPNLL